ncbi:class I SAM-dependent methyltransferase [Actinomadura sp. LOL_016]|uniref:class I SAM-dependent methyltransferase n=1 Tax=unclassified Actinomadura TaxID=2626254 RepID=UPI003A7FE6CD
MVIISIQVDGSPAIHRWTLLLKDRLRDRTAGGDAVSAQPALSEAGLDTLAVKARRVTGPVVDVCMRRFPQASRVLDLGGGHGELSLEFARRGIHPTMQDLPGVMEIVERRGRLPAAGVELFPGDLFAELPSGPFDLVLCSAVTTLFDGAANLDLYRRLRPLIRPGGGLAIVSYLRERAHVSAAFALQMLVWTDGGDAHGEDDYRRWLAEAGYGAVRLHDLDDPPQTIVLAER